jgi:hypothetical protein
MLARALLALPKASSDPPTVQWQIVALMALRFSQHASDAALMAYRSGSINECVNRGVVCRQAVDNYLPQGHAENPNRPNVKLQDAELLQKLARPLQ